MIVWCPTPDSNRENLVSKTSAYAIPPAGQILVGEQGVEPCTTRVLRGYSPTIYRSCTRPMFGGRCGIRTHNEQLLRLPCLPITPIARDYRSRYRNRKVVCAAGFEPATPRFQGENSGPTELRTEVEGRGRGHFMIPAL